MAKAAKFSVRLLSLKGNPILRGSSGSIVVEALAKVGVRLTLENLVYATATDVHLPAF